MLLDNETKKNEEKTVTVFELTEQIKNMFKNEFDELIIVTGEISNWKLSKTNVFFTLKDENASINAVIWNYNSNKKDIDNGKKVKIHGSLTIFNKSGTYNLTVKKIELLGIGDLHNQYMKLKEKYEKLGYFDQKNKKPKPDIIKKIGIITAEGGAALQDFLYVVKKNDFIGEIYIKNCIVQGKDCSKSVANAIKELDKYKFDLIILSRGGGSFEDLFGFSEACVLEELYHCKTCTISAIGHEVDWMLSDYVADIRAPTPSIAGEIVSSKKEDTISRKIIDDSLRILKNMINNKIISVENNIKFAKKTIVSPIDNIVKLKESISILDKQLLNMINYKINGIQSNINVCQNMINKLNNIKDSNKWACILYDSNDNKIMNINDFKNLGKNKKKLKLVLSDGTVVFNMTSVKIINE